MSLTGKDDLAVARHKLGSIEFFRSDAYVRLNDIAKPFGKRVQHWMELESTNRLLKQYPEGIQCVEGRNGGTFAIKEIADEFERWCQKTAIQRPNRVYFIQADKMDVFKVGVASNSSKRLRDLQTGSPVKLILLRDNLSDDAENIESEIHRKLKGYHSHGEWFSWSIKKALAIFDSYF